MRLLMFDIIYLYIGLFAGVTDRVERLTTTWGPRSEVYWVQINF